MVRNTLHTPAGALGDDSYNISAQRPGPDDLRVLVDTVREDVKAIEAFYNCNISKTRIKRLQDYYRTKSQELEALHFHQLDHQSQIDFVLLRKHIERQLHGLQASLKQREELEPFIQPCADELIDLLERRQKVVPTEGQYAASQIAVVCSEMHRRHSKIADGSLRMGDDRFAAYRSVQALEEIRNLLKEWFGFHCGYDPTFTWWVTAPYEKLLRQTECYMAIICEKLLGVGAGEKDAIVGQPVGRDGILADLEAQFIAYSPEELIQISDNEYAWCEAEMLKASRDLGHGSDWKAALEHVKNMYVEPGRQTHLVHELAEEAIAYVKKNDMVTIPPIAEECWRTYMMSPKRQKANPFFLGGESMIISYPTDTMSHEDKLMSMRGNSRPFSRSTVFHELIPGHHLQFHMMARYKNYRCLFDTPFWMEGWAFYWEFILWDRGFAQTPEEKIGMMFWRMHRCARIVFSLKFHLGQMTPQECIDYLVEKVGHERATAEGEVRRSFNGDYSPLYQAGYMLGALQFYALRKEMLGEGGMREKEFHDRILREGEMPVEILRALLQRRKLKPNHKAEWRFYDL